VGGEPDPGQFGELLGQLDAEEPALQLDAGVAGRAGAAEGIHDQVARLGGTGHDRPEQGEGELRRKLGQSLARVLDKPRDPRIDAPDVVPELAVRVGPLVAVFRLAVARSALISVGSDPLFAL
jgi:hypothetical protein